MNIIPKHVAIIMDGNGRWAKQRHLPRAAGHRAGAKAVRKAVEFAAKNKIEVLSLFALSIENRNFRPKHEVSLLMTLFTESLEKDTPELHKNNIQVRIVGDRTVFSEKLQQKIVATETLTANNTGLKLVIAVNYSGRWDIVQATQRVLRKYQQSNVDLQNIDEAMMTQELTMPDLPEPDLLIRTSGEQRISNFMLWQLAYTELFFSDVLWPAFNDTSFREALDYFQTCDRRFGRIEEAAELCDA